MAAREPRRSVCNQPRFNTRVPLAAIAIPLASVADGSFAALFASRPILVSAFDRSALGLLAGGEGAGVRLSEETGETKGFLEREEGKVQGKERRDASQNGGCPERTTGPLRACASFETRFSLSCA